jgi:hypothetical protein
MVVKNGGQTHSQAKRRCPSGQPRASPMAASMLSMIAGVDQHSSSRVDHIECRVRSRGDYFKINMLLPVSRSLSARSPERDVHLLTQGLQASSDIATDAAYLLPGLPNAVSHWPVHVSAAGGRSGRRLRTPW